MREDIIERLEALDRLSHVDIVHILKRGTANVLFYDENVGLALEHDCGTVFSVPFRERGLRSLRCHVHSLPCLGIQVERSMLYVLLSW